MISFLSADANLPFVIALALMAGIALLEAFGVLVGVSISQLADNALGSLDAANVDVDVDVDADIDADVDADAHVGSGGTDFLSGVLGWFCIGQVPFLILLVVLLTFFGLIGLAIQGVVHELFGVYIPGALAWLPALAAALPLLRAFGRTFAKYVPKVETTALSKDTFIGLVATVIRGEARQEQPAEAKVVDRHGLTHYLLVEPDVGGELFIAGDEVLLVRRNGNRFWGIRNPHSALSPSQGA